MPYFPVDDQFAFHPKATAAGNAAVGVWTRAGAWCKNHATGGRIPFEAAHAIGSKGLCKKLVAVGLWHDIEGGYEFHDWEHQAGNFDAGTEKERREKERERNRERQRKFRESQRNGANGDRNGVTNGGVTDPPSPSPIPPTYVRDISPVLETGESYPQGRDKFESEEELCTRQAASIGVEFAKVKLAIAKECGRFPGPTLVMQIIATVLSRAKPPVKSPTGMVLSSIKADPFEFQQMIDEAVA